jgi:hypothetical protein
MVYAGQFNLALVNKHIISNDGNGFCPHRTHAIGGQTVPWQFDGLAELRHQCHHEERDNLHVCCIVSLNGCIYASKLLVNLMSLARHAQLGSAMVCAWVWLVIHMH